MSAGGLTRPGLVLILVLAAACGGGDARPSQPLGPPPVNPNLSVISQGTLDLEVTADRPTTLAPSTYSPAGTTVPCDQLVFLFTWRAEKKASLAFVILTDEKGTVDVAKGAEGTASVGGCSLLGAMAAGKDDVTAQVRYVLAQTR